MQLPVALSIAGSDPSGGAGIQADLKTFHRFGVYGEAAVTLITVQNTRAVTRVQVLDPELITQQIRAVVEDIPPQAAKTGALGSAEVVHAVAEIAREFTFPLVIDPVMISKHGAPLLSVDAQEVFRRELLPQAALLTPNLPEAAALVGFDVHDLASMREAAQRLVDLGAAAVLVKGGHLATGDAVDLLLWQSGWHEFTAPRIATRHTHGTGCTYSAAITAGLAQGQDLVSAITAAKAFVTAAIRTAPGFGEGAGPLNHFALLDQ